MKYIKQFRQVPVLVLASVLLTTAANAQTLNSFNVHQAVDYAMKNATVVKNALIDIQVQKEVNREITSAAYPQLNASGALNEYLNIPTSLLPAEIAGGTPGTYLPVKFGTKYNATGGFDVSQILFDGQVFVGLQARSAAIAAAEKVKDVTTEMINVNVQKVYYQLVVGRQQLTTIDANIERFQKLFNDTKAMFDQGFMERLDVDKVSVQLNNLQTEKIKQQNRLDAGFAGLKFLMNMPQKDSLQLTDSLTVDQVKDNVLSSQYNYPDRKEFQLLEITRKLRAYNIKRYKLSYLPILSAFGNYSKNAQRTKFDFFKGGSNRQWFTTSLIGLKLNVPIFDGFARRARVNQAKLALQKTENDIEQLKQSIDNDVIQANLSISASFITLDNQRRNMELAEKVYNTTKIKYDQGLGSNQEIYNAQAELKTAQNNYYSALYDAVIAKIDFLKATGKL